MHQQPTGKRKPISVALRREVLIEAGYRCAVPTCRNILALDLHHIIPVEESGPNALSNLLALCPTCHALYTRGTIPQEAINAWKLVLVSLTNAFDTETISQLLFLHQTQSDEVWITGDGLLRLSHLIAAGMAETRLIQQYYPWRFYTIKLTVKGQRVIEAWCSGDRQRVLDVLADLPQSY